MKIKDVVCAAGSTGFYFDDQRAIKRGAGHDGMFYIGQPVTEGFSAVRMKGEAVSVMIVLEDGQIAFGDCAAVQYSGAGGRDPLFLAKDFIPIIEQYVRPMLLGREADDFRGLCAQMEAIEVNGKRLHTAIRYGVSQAILDAVAKATGRLMCEVSGRTSGSRLCCSRRHCRRCIPRCMNTPHWKARAGGHSRSASLSQIGRAHV